jgi:hypothetical protein
MGIIVPKIYIPSTLDAEAKAYVIHHEKMHIRRKDHLIRFISFIALVLHWFNPSVWMAFILSGKDMEMSCDEAVLKELGTDIKKHYSNTLLSITTGNSRFRGTALTLAFGEHDVKSRIKNILNYKKPSTWLITITVILTIVLSVTLLTNPHTLEGDFPGGNFGVKDIVYTSPQYSFTYQLETAPVYAVSSDYVFYSKEKDDHEFNLVGYAYKVKLSEDELLQLFLFEGSVDEHMASILKNIKNIYRVDDKNSTMTYLILGNDKGDIFIASGYRNGNEEMESVRWLFEMERIKLDDFVLSATELWQYRTEYLGDNSAVAGIISGLECPEELTYTGFSLKTKDQPYGITIDLSASNDTVINLDDLTKDVLLQLDACIFFSLVGNVENITFSIDGGNLEKSSIGFSRGKANEIAGMDLWEESSNEADYSGMLLTIKEVLSSGGNDIIDVTSDALIDFTTDIKDETTNDISDETINETTGIVSDEELLERAISEAILTYNTKYGTLGAFNCESHVILATTTNELVINDTITVYAQVLFQSFDKQLIGLNNASGSFSTNVITFNKDENGTYELVEYWVPRDGSYYESDIRDKFPDDMEEAALDTQKNIVYQMQACYKQAIEALDVNTTKAIEALLDTIMSSPMESSSPYDYTLAHPIEYRELTYYGDYTLAYIEDQLTQGETGLKAKIMEILYNEMTSAGE